MSEKAPIYIVLVRVQNNGDLMGRRMKGQKENTKNEKWGAIEDVSVCSGKEKETGNPEYGGLMGY